MVKSLNVSESSSESWPRRLGLALIRISKAPAVHQQQDLLTHSHLDRTEVADQQLGYLGRSIGHYSTRPGTHAAGDRRSSPLLVDMDYWRPHYNSHYGVSASFSAAGVK